jgi:PadR family transcriptional regulator PadR
VNAYFGNQQACLARAACNTSNCEVSLVIVGARDSNPNFMNGVPELLILRLLHREEMYGYQIVECIRDRTDSVIAIGEGVVYPVLHGLERAGALKSRRKTVNGRSRIYYSVTRAGKGRLAELSESWNSLTAAIHKMLKAGQHVEAF